MAVGSLPFFKELRVLARHYLIKPLLNVPVKCIGIYILKMWALKHKWT